MEIKNVEDEITQLEFFKNLKDEIKYIESDPIEYNENDVIPEINKLFVLK